MTDKQQGEKFIDTKKRLEKRTGFKGKNFEKIKFAVVKRNSYSKPHYLTDGKCSHIMRFIASADNFQMTNLMSWSCPTSSLD